MLTRDAIITCIVNTLTCLIAGVLVFSILGYMAHIQETTIDEVVNSGPGLVFLTYPDLVSVIRRYCPHYVSCPVSRSSRCQALFSGLQSSS